MSRCSSLKKRPWRAYCPTAIWTRPSIRSPGPASGRRVRGISRSSWARSRKAWWAARESATAQKAKRTIAAILSYLTLLHDEILEAFPAGKVPPIEKTTMRTEKEMEPYLKEPFTEGWRPIYAIPKMGL